MTGDKQSTNWWTLWGFQRHTRTDNTNQTPQPLLQQQWEPITTNGNTHHNHHQQAQMFTMANHLATIENQQQQTNNWTTATNNTTIRIKPQDTTNPNWEHHETTPLPIPMQPATGAISDTYINPWGNHMEQPKLSDTVQIFLQNFGGWPKSTKNQKNDNIHQFVNSVEMDIFQTTENNLAWHKLPSNNRLHERTRGWWESLHVSMVHNTTDKNTGTYQPGGVRVFCINHATHQIKMAGPDQNSRPRPIWPG